MTTPQMPEGFTEVSKDEFYAVLYAEKRDIMPSVEQPRYTIWRVQATREMWGWSVPGWNTPPGEKHRYALRNK